MQQTSGPSLIKKWFIYCTHEELREAFHSVCRVVVMRRVAGAKVVVTFLESNPSRNLSQICVSR